MNSIFVLESPVVELFNGKFVDCYCTLKVVNGLVSVDAEYNGFVGTANTDQKVSNLNEALKLAAQRSLVKKAVTDMLNKFAAFRKLA